MINTIPLRPGMKVRRTPFETVYVVREWHISTVREDFAIVNMVDGPFFYIEDVYSSEWEVVA